MLNFLSIIAIFICTFVQIKTTIIDKKYVESNSPISIKPLRKPLSYIPSANHVFILMSKARIFKVFGKTQKYVVILVAI